MLPQEANTFLMVVIIRTPATMFRTGATIIILPTTVIRPETVRGDMSVVLGVIRNILPGVPFAKMSELEL